VVRAAAHVLTGHARSLATTLLDLLLPAACPVCEAMLDAGEDGVVCGRCWTRIAPLAQPQCARCGHPGTRERCAWCELLPAHVRAARSVCWMHRGTGAAIVHAMKYHGWSAVASGIAARMARLSWPLDVLEERTAVLPVPLANARRRERGFNQSERIAEALALRWRVPVWRDVLVRVRATETQTRLTPEERLANVSGAFRVRDLSCARLLRNAHVVLVDDVVTTAATLNACAAALVTGGARIVSYATFGRAPGAGDR